jgi:hypothetical protein
MAFVTREVLPRQRWYDFETFLSCARKPFDFYDAWTAQYPQNSLSMIQAAKAYLKLYQLTKDERYLVRGNAVTDYLVLLQQVWIPPLFSPKLFGGFTTQNTDAEWSDARQCYVAELLFDYYKETRSAEFLERAVAAARSSFAVAPWENWAHTGFADEPGSLTGIHWGTGSGMTSVEMMSGLLGDAFIDVRRSLGVGFNACTVAGLKVAGTAISFRLESAGTPRPVRIRFAGIRPELTYRLAPNGHDWVEVAGRRLVDEGYLFEE